MDHFLQYEFYHAACLASGYWNIMMENGKI